MAIFNMEDSSINEYYLNEHGGAHRRYAEMIADKDKKLKNREKAFESIGTDAADEKANEARRKRERLFHDSLKYIDKGANDYISTIYEKRRENEKNGKTVRGEGSLDRRSRYKESKKNFKRDFGGPSEKRVAVDTSTRKPGTYLAAQKKLKEAAEYILSVLDEMDYIEESYYDNDENHFLNEGISDFFKDAEIKNKINNDKSLVYKNTNLQSYITEIHNEIIKAIKNKKIRNCKYYNSNSKNSNSYTINAYAKDYPIKYNGTVAYTTNINSKVKHELIEYVNDYINNEILDSGDKVKFSLQESTNESNTELDEKDISGDVYFNFTVYIGKNNLRKYVNK